MIGDFFEQRRAKQEWEYNINGNINIVPYHMLVEMAYLGNLSPKDLVRKKNGLWVEAKTVKELKRAFKAREVQIARRGSIDPLSVGLTVMDIFFWFMGK